MRKPTRIVELRESLKWCGELRTYRSVCLHELFDEQAKRIPENPAVLYDMNVMTYAELNRRKNELAWDLRRRGVGPEVRVGICMERGVDALVAILAVLEAGGAYVPLDPAYPSERLAYMASDAKPALVITHEKLLGRTPSDNLLTIDQNRTLASSTRHGANLLSGVRPENLAHVFYTSGSTGRPKGVMGTHNSVINRLSWMWDAYPYNNSEVCCQKTSLSFVDSLAEMFSPLLRGVPLVILSDDLVKDADSFVSALERYAVTRIVVVPSLLRSMLVVNSNVSVQLRALRLLVTSGETLPVDVAKSCRQRLPHVVLLNLYGSSEVMADATWAMYTDDSGNDYIPIGRPIWNTATYVLDEHLDFVPVGTVGELYIAGAGLARGYVERPGMTAERFVVDPYGKPGTRMYRTGDLASWDFEGNLRYLGREDQQVKIRGYRIEIGEVESRLRDQPSVRNAAVVAREEKDGDRRLVAYVIASEGHTLFASELRRALERSLPEYMIPSAIVMVRNFPLTPSGKLDRAELSATEFADLAGDYRAPRTPREDVLCSLFAEVLGVGRVGIDDNFFELGGHSLMATQLVSRIRTDLLMELTIRTVFEAPTVTELLARLQEPPSPVIVLENCGRPAFLPCSYAQQRLWFVDQLKGSNGEYNTIQALRITGELDMQALEQAVNGIIGRHEALRTRFLEEGGEPIQVIEPELRIPLSHEDLSGLEEKAQEEALQAAMRRQVHEVFDLARVPLLRVGVVKLGAKEHVIVRTVHHIVSDGWSDWVFNRELSALYKAYRNGVKDPLTRLKIQYGDYTLWQRAWLERVGDHQLAYWKQQLAGIPERFQLITRLPAFRSETFAAGVCREGICKQSLELLRKLSYKNGATLYMTLLAGLAALLFTYNSCDDITVGSPIANRDSPELESLIGYFVNTLILRIRLKPEMHFLELLRHVRETALGAYQHQRVPFEKVVEFLSVKGHITTGQLLDVQLVMQNMPSGVEELEGLIVQPLDANDRELRLGLQLNPMVVPSLSVIAVERNDQLALTWVYNPKVFERWKIEHMSRHYVRLLERVVAQE